MSTQSNKTDAQAIQELYQKPRSERAKALFQFDPFDYQAELLDKSAESHITQCAVKPGRQVGKTETGGLIAADEFLKGSDVMILGPFQDTVEEMMESFKRHIDTLQSVLQGSDVSLTLTTENEMEYESASGGRVRAKTVGSRGTQIRGKNPNVVLVDEAAYVKESIFTEVIEPFFSTHESYQYYLFSTPAGKSGYFYDAVEGKNSSEWYSPHWPSSISPLISEEFLEKKREQLPTQTFAQEYLGEFAEDGGSAIPYDTLTPNINPDAPHKSTHPRFLAIDPARKGDDEMVAFDMAGNGIYWNIWAFETINGPQFLEFVHSVHKRERYNEDISVPWSGTYPEPEVGTGTTPNNGYQTILIEENGVGGFGADFAQAGLGNVVKVVNSTNETKQNMYQRLITDLEKQALALPNHAKLVSQTTKLQKNFTPTNKAKYEHPPGGHDDYPDALAMVNWARHGNGQTLTATGHAGKASPTFGW